MRRDSIDSIHDPDLARRINVICDRFSGELASDSKPRIEDYLNQCPEQGLSSLFRELLFRELEYHRQHSELQSIDTYVERFPDASETIESIFREVQSVGSHDTTLASMSTQGLDFSMHSSTTVPVPSTSKVLPPGYSFIKRLGQGGMGEVYLARQESADRLVALKIIRADRIASGVLEGEVITRFRREIKAAARLDHDHVVSVYDVGEWLGQPYFTMRYISGQSLRQRLSDGPLQDRLAATIMRDVANAMSAAHTLGILHRDLKPHNILIEEPSNRALVADFGLAKVVGGDEEMTVEGAVFGSPPYMAPEQARDASRANDASDIYGIGATLYHALTGRPPFQAASVPETLHQVVHTEAIPVRKLNPSAAIDLETICMKCLTKEASGRYPSAAALADDLQRFLEDRPIAARPTGAMEKAWRWTRRNRGVAALLAALLLSLVTGSLAAFDQWRKSVRNFNTAQANFEMARNRLQLGQEVMRELLVNVSKEELRDIAEIEPVRQALLQKALGYYDKFIEEAKDDPTLQREQAQARAALGEIYFWLGDFEAAQQELFAAKKQVQLLLTRTQALQDTQELRVTLSEIHLQLGVVSFRKGELDRAEDEFLAFQELAGALPSTDSEPNLGPASAWDSLASVYREQGKLSEARIAYQQSLVYLDSLENQDHSQVLQMLATSNYNLSLVMRELGEVDEAARIGQAALRCVKKWKERAPESVVQQNVHAHVLQGIGWTENALGNSNAALDSLLAADMIEQRLVDDHPLVPRYRFESGRLKNSIAFTYGLLGNSKMSLQTLDEATDLLSRLVDDEPDIAEYAGLLGEVQLSRGWALRSNDPAQSVEAYREAIRLLKQGLVPAPDNTHMQTLLGQAFHELGMLYAAVGDDPQSANEAYAEAYKTRSKLVDRIGSSALLESLAYTCGNMSWVLLSLGDDVAALQRNLEALDLWERINELSPSSTNQVQLGEAFFNTAQFHFECAAMDPGTEALEQALSLAYVMLDEDPNNQQFRSRLGLWLETWCDARVLLDPENADVALQRSSKALTLLKSTYKDAPEPKSDDAVVRLHLQRSSIAARCLGDFDLAASELTMAESFAGTALDTCIELAKLELQARRGESDMAVEKAPQFDSGDHMRLLPMARVYLLAAANCNQDSSLLPPERERCREQHLQHAIRCMKEWATFDKYRVHRTLAWDSEFAEVRTRLADQP